MCSMTVLKTPDRFLFVSIIVPLRPFSLILTFVVRRDDADIINMGKIHSGQFVSGHFGIKLSSLWPKTSLLY